MSRRPIRNHSPAFKPKVSLSVVKAEQTITDQAQRLRQGVSLLLGLFHGMVTHSIRRLRAFVFYGWCNVKKQFTPPKQRNVHKAKHLSTER